MHLASPLDQSVTVFDALGSPVSFSLRSLLCRRGTDLYSILRALGFAAEFKDADFETLLARMLARVPDTLDKRQGSIIYDALAPAAVELTEAYIERDANRALSYASMSAGQWLDMRVFEHGVSRLPATKAVRFGLFYADDEQSIPFDDVPIGGRYSVPNDELNFVATKRVANGVYQLTCEEPGLIGNDPTTGTALIPVDYLPGLAAIVLGETVIPGENKEDDAALFERFVRTITRPPFGGNRADYETYFRAIDGIGSVKLFRADPEKGHVTAILLGADLRPPSDTLVEAAQTAIDPIVNHGEGLGLAPMAHIVHVEGACPHEVSIAAQVVLIRGWTIGQVEADVRAAIEAYLVSLRLHWADYTALDSPDYVETIVRIAQLEAAILTVEGVADVANATIDGATANLLLTRAAVPMLKELTLEAVSPKGGAA